MREKCPNMELFLVRIQSEYGKIRTRKNSVFGHFSGSVVFVKRFSVGVWLGSEHVSAPIFQYHLLMEEYTKRKKLHFL